MKTLAAARSSPAPGQLKSRFLLNRIYLWKMTMKEITEIRDALMRLSCIGDVLFHYDPSGQVFGDGEIHYLVEIIGRFFMAWESSDTRMMIVNPITRFNLDELEELGAEEAWTVLHVPAELSNGIRFRDIDIVELKDVYCRMAAQSLSALSSDWRVR
jgi:hypothetical protein